MAAVLRAFRNDPGRRPLPTPSGKIEIFSETIAGFGYADCPRPPGLAAAGRACRMPRRPLPLIANQPATRLHSQLDFGGHSQSTRSIAAARSSASTRPMPRRAASPMATSSACSTIAAPAWPPRASPTTSCPAWCSCPTGAWYDPDDPAEDAPLCVHGNPNVLTRDIGTSRLAQGCTGQLTTVEVERFNGNLPPIRAFDPPDTAVGPARGPAVAAE